MWAWSGPLMVMSRDGVYDGPLRGGGKWVVLRRVHSRFWEDWGESGNPAQLPWAPRVPDALHLILAYHYSLGVLWTVGQDGGSYVGRKEREILDQVCCGHVFEPFTTDSCFGDGSLRVSFGCGLLFGDRVDDSGEEGKANLGFRQKDTGGTIHRYFPLHWKPSTWSMPRGGDGSHAVAGKCCIYWSTCSALWTVYWEIMAGNSCTDWRCGQEPTGFSVSHERFSVGPEAGVRVGRLEKGAPIFTGS